MSVQFMLVVAAAAVAEGVAVGLTGSPPVPDAEALGHGSADGEALPDGSADAEAAADGSPDADAVADGSP
jgi:hypothetical protein